MNRAAKQAADPNSVRNFLPTDITDLSPPTIEN